MQSALSQNQPTPTTTQIAQDSVHEHTQNLASTPYSGVTDLGKYCHQFQFPSDTCPRKLKYFLQKGGISIHLRSNYMQTINQGPLLDYNTMAIGAGLGYTTPFWKGFRIGFSGFFVFQLFENNIRKADPITGAGNRYEILLYDMNRIHNTHDLDRLEELYLSYQKKNFLLKIGRQKINTPLLNEQDNRMRPNIFSGILAEYRFFEWDIIAAFFNQATLRGTVDWYSIEESFGVYPFGRNPLGVAESYKNNTRTKGIALIGAKYHKKSKVYQWQLEGWNYLVENVFNTTFLQTELKIKTFETAPVIGIQGFFQTPIQEGGNPNPSKAYILPNEKAWGIGGKIGITLGKGIFSMNYLRIGPQGRFLFPREWGREVFFVSLPRERLEGNADLYALTLKYSSPLPIKNLFTELGISQVNPPDIQKVPLNKYGLPAYYHFLIQFQYKFTSYLEGLNIRFLIVNKTAQKPKEIPDNFRINRVDMWHINLILDYLF
ncbi:MAG: OprD family outer membrane porin [Bacteroidia bacterium]|nr:OprD family outer membrane porin [Bacteroidia bacterium]